MRRSNTAVAVLVAVVVASCSTGTIGSTTTIVPTPSPGGSSVTSTTPPETGTTLTTTSTTDGVAVTTGISYDITVEVTSDGEVVVTGPDVIHAKLGSEVDLTIISSIDEEMHIHGYDLRYDLVAGEETAIGFVANVPGIFEAELEGQHQPVFDLEVTP